LEPGDIDVRNDLGMTLGQLGRFPEAIAQFQTALQHNPNSAQTHFNLYLALMGAGRPDEAFGHYHTARQLDPNVGRQ
jgi:superkiller protein 3